MSNTISSTGHHFGTETKIDLSLYKYIKVEYSIPCNSEGLFRIQLTPEREYNNVGEVLSDSVASAIKLGKPPITNALIIIDISNVRGSYYLQLTAVHVVDFYIHKILLTN